MSIMQYKDEVDRSYGMAGMVMAMYVWDCENYLIGLNMDTVPGDGVKMSPILEIQGNPRLSARVVWQQMLKEFELSTAMLLGNAMCRCYCGGTFKLTSSVLAKIRAFVRDEGKEVCSLEEEEIKRVYEKVYNYMDQLFIHVRAVETAKEISAALLANRALSAAETIDRLSNLR